MKRQLSEGFQSMWNSLVSIMPEIIVGFLLLFVFIFIGSFLRSIVKKRLRLRMNDQLLINFIGRVIFLTFLTIGVIVFFNQVGLGKAASGLLAGAGVSAIVLGFAFKDIGENFLAGFFLAFSRPFSIGDIIEVIDKVGTVKALSFRNTHIRTFDGRDIYMPNAILLKNPLTNYTKDGLLRHDFIIGLDYDDDMVKANQTILDELSQISNISTAEGLAPFVVINDFGTSTVNLKVHFWINTFDFLGSTTVLKSSVMRQVLERLAKEGFSMPADIIEFKFYKSTQGIPVTIEKSIES